MLIEKDSKKEGRTKMKVGIRMPNVKNRVKSRTTARAKRAVKRSVNPLYGKKGMGFVNNPKKAVYNKVYKKTTIPVDDLVKGGDVNISDKNTNKKKHGCLIPIIALLVLFGGCSLLFGGNDDDKVTDPMVKEATTEKVTTETTTGAVTEPTTEATTEAAINTESAKERVRNIKAKSKKNAKDASKEDLNAAAKDIAENLTSCFDDEATMEQVLASGYLLYFHYGPKYTAGELGSNTVKAIRPVYEKGIDPESDEVNGYVNAAITDMEMIADGTAVYPTRAATTEETTETKEITFIINTNSGKIHKVNGPDTDTIAPENRLESTESYEELIDKGWEPCGRCFP